jgi:hypothetical protein
VSNRERLALALGIELPEMRIARARGERAGKQKARRRKAAKVAAKARARNR